jgi:chemotaxis protein MotA
MTAIIGLVVLMICVFGGFVIAGGSLAPIIKAAPYEMFIIAGAGIGGMITGNSSVIFKGAMGGFGRVIKGPMYTKDDYVAIIAVISKLMKTLKAEGAVAMESHVENPEASAIFGECPKMLHDHGLIGLICDTIRLMVVSSGTLSPYAVEDVMTASIKLHHHSEMQNADAICNPRWRLACAGYCGLCVGCGEDHGRD